MQVFSKEWFAKYQRPIRFFANTWVGRKFFCIDGKRSGIGKRKIAAMLPNSITWVNDDGSYTTEFRTHEKFAKRLYYGLYPLWKFMHEWDRLLAEPFAPVLDFGFATLSAMPVAGANSPCDGPVNRVSQNETFATIIAGAGNQGGLTTTTSDTQCGLKASTTTNQFSDLRRSIFNFDTSALTGSANISATTIGIVYNFKTNGLGDADPHFCGATPAATNAIPASDFSNIGTTSFGSIGYSSVNTDNTTYNTISFNASGIAAVSKTGITSIGEKISWDMNQSFTGSWSSGADTRVQGIFADETGTSKDPTLTVTYTLGGSTFISRLIVNQSVKRAGTF